MPTYTVTNVNWPADVALEDFCATAQAALGAGVAVSATYRSGEKDLRVEITGASPSQNQVENAVGNWAAKTSTQVTDAARAAYVSQVADRMQSIRNAIDGANNVTGLKVACTRLCDEVTKLMRYVVNQEKV